jgi:hypothetical protein
MFILKIVAVAPEVSPTIAAAVGVPEVDTMSAISLSVAAPINPAVASYLTSHHELVLQQDVSAANVPSASAPISP